jgi:GntR family transcriptional repressor for pyruvate dehydrogenase complex
VQVHATAVPRVTAVAFIADQILRQVAAGTLKPGDRLPPLKDLAAQFGVAVGTVREAVSALAHTGHLESLVGVGTFVRAPRDEEVTRNAWMALPESEADFLEFLEARRDIEALTSGYAAQRATPEQIARLRRLVQACAAAIAEIDREPDNPAHLEALNTADTAFHDAVAEAAANRPLRQALYTLRAALRGRFARLRRSLSPREIDRWAGLELHEELVAAIAARDRQAATRLANEIVDLTTSWHLKVGPGGGAGSRETVRDGA